MSQPEKHEQSAAWHSVPSEKVLENFDTSRDGLAGDEAARRLERHGPNKLSAKGKKSALARFLSQFHDILIYVLLGAAGITAMLALIDGPSHWIDTVIIVAVVVINALIGFIQEGKAEEALDAIRNMLSVEATVVRDGNRIVIPAEEVAPGDIVVLRTGDKVAADIRLIEARELGIEESALTGESVPSSKRAETLVENTSLGDRKCMAFSSTLVTSGSGLGVVVATGDRTEIGRISEMVSETPELTTPLIRQMNTFGKIIAGVVLALAVITFGLGALIGDESVINLFLASVALAVAAIPEGLPAVMTIILALGVRRMAGRHAIIRRLAAVDTLGALTVICSDKTGTLTRNEMTVTRIVTADGLLQVSGGGYAPEGRILDINEAVELRDGSAAKALVEIGVLCNDSDLRQQEGNWIPEGDPMESALLTLAMKAELPLEETRKNHRVIDTIPFDSSKKYMATLNAYDDGAVLCLKGAPERVFAMCGKQLENGQEADFDKEYWSAKAEAMAAEGNRVLAAAWRRMPEGTGRINDEDLTEDLVMIGLWGIMDPPRDEAIEAVEHCHEAGIRVVMITGDHGMTAKAIGKQVGIGDGDHVRTGNDLDQMDEEGLTKAAREIDVFARVSPQHKLTLVESLQKTGEVVAMTGDGVNDAPALKRADVGIAMGIKGTEVTKEAAEMVLTDDNFASIANAVEEGRTVYDNLRKSILFILPTNGGQGLTILMAILLGQTLPLTPVQVLWVNMVTAVTLALALSFEPPEADVMKRRPRDPKSNLLSGYYIGRIVYVSILIWAGTFGMFVAMLRAGMEIEYARTVAVNAIVVFEIFYLFNCRKIMSPVVRPFEFVANRMVLFAIGAVVVLQLAFTYVPVVQRLFGTTGIGMVEWGMILILGVGIFLLVEIEKMVLRRSGKQTA